MSVMCDASDCHAVGMQLRGVSEATRDASKCRMSAGCANIIGLRQTGRRRELTHNRRRQAQTARPTGVNPAGDAGDTHPNILVVGDVNGNVPQYYYVLSDIADQYRLPSVRSASSRFHSAIRRRQFASVPSHTSPHSVVRPPNLELALTPLARPLGAHPVPPNLYIFPEFSVCDRDGNDNNMELAALKSS